jgi:serine/threonine-protein kinase
MTAPGAVVGTPYFMSPEQCAARRIGPQSDQYSLGVVLFQMLTGMVPFHAETLPAIMHHHFYSAVPDVGAVRPDVPDALRSVLERALAKKPEERYATTGAMLAAVEDIPFSADDRRIAESMLAALALGAPLPKVAASPLPPMPSATPSSLRSIGAPERRPRARLAWAAAALVVAAAAGGAAFMGRSGAPEPTMIAANVPALVPVESTVVHRTVPAPAPESMPSATRTSRDGAPAARNAAQRDSAPRAAPQRAAVAPPTAAAVARGRVRVRAFPSDARILVDGKLLGIGAVVDSLLASGERRLRVEAPGYAPFDTVISVRAGETTQVRSITLVAAEAGQ